MKKFYDSLMFILFIISFLITFLVEATLLLGPIVLAIITADITTLAFYSITLPAAIVLYFIISKVI